MVKNSVRNCKLIGSLMWKYLCAEKSKLVMPGSRTSGSRRPVVPNVNGSGYEKTDELNHRFKVRSSEARAVRTLQPLRWSPPLAL